MPTPRPPDRRVARTRRALREALVSLIVERGYDETTVQDVLERADVGRSTFYTHFADKDDLLTSGFDELRAALHAARAAIPDAPLGFAPALIAHAEGHRHLFRAIVGKRTGHAVQKRFRQLVLELVRADLTALAPADPRLDTAVHFVAGGFVELLSWWIDAGAPLPKAELHARFLALALPAVEPLRTRA